MENDACIPNRGSAIKAERVGKYPTKCIIALSAHIGRLGSYH